VNPDDVAARLTDELGRRAPTLGAIRLVCVDGPAGSGKTTLGAAIARAANRLGSVRLVQMDDLYEGWTGLTGDLTDRIARLLLAPLRDGRTGRYRRYDWQLARFAETHSVDPVDTLVLEGVGSGAAAYDELITLLVWVEAPQDLRLERGVERDGVQVLPEWLRWVEQEDRVFTRDRTRQRADVLVDGTGAGPPVVVTRCGPDA
jgi:uridine kinase